MAAVIEIDGLTKDYPRGFWVRRSVRALDRLSLTVSDGEIFGFLGPNGAGKTTTLKLLMRIIYPTAGSARILGQPIGSPELYRQIGYLPEQPYFYDYLTAEELLHYFGRLFGLSSSETRARARRLLAQVGLSDSGATPLRKFSKGMLQRIGIAQALLNQPRVLFLDEPFSGLDPIGRRELREIVRELNREGVTLFFSSHILADVESLCDRFAILHRGRLLDSGELQAALDQESRSIEIIAAGVPPALRPRLEAQAAEVTPFGDRMRILVPREQGLGTLAGIIESLGGRIVAVNPVRPSLEELFMGRIAREMETRTQDSDEPGLNP